MTKKIFFSMSWRNRKIIFFEKIKDLQKLSFWMFVGVWLFALTGCQAGRLLDRHLLITEGPKLHYGRMSDSLGVVKFDDGTVLVIGGSPTEKNFSPHKGKKSIELLKPPYRQWELTDIDVPYRIAGRAFALSSDTIIAFLSVFSFDVESTSLETEPDPKKPHQPISGAVSAAIINLKTKSIVPIYRSKNNEACRPPLTGHGIALQQKAFNRTIMLRSGKIIRVGGYNRYQSPAPEIRCEQNKCRYCLKENCTPHPEFDYSCHTKKDCPIVWGKRRYVLGKDIEIYTPPDAAHPNGSVRCISLPSGRSGMAIIELPDGQVLITGGWGVKGEGARQFYTSTFILNPETASLAPGPQMLQPREDHRMLLLGNGRVLITGGTNEYGKTVRTSEIYDPKARRFIHAHPMSLSREKHLPIRLGPWALFLGGEVNEKADQIRNSGEAFDYFTGTYISSFLLYKRPDKGQLDAGMAGISTGAVVSLYKNSILLFGGQQGLQDCDGEYISAGKGTVRTLILQYVDHK